jgi:hypothetical protein
MIERERGGVRLITGVCSCIPQLAAVCHLWWWGVAWRRRAHHHACLCMGATCLM